MLLLMLKIIHTMVAILFEFIHQQTYILQEYLNIDRQVISSGETVCDGTFSPQ